MAFPGENNSDFELFFYFVLRFSLFYCIIRQGVGLVYASPDVVINLYNGLKVFNGFNFILKLFLLSEKGNLCGIISTILFIVKAILLS